MVTTKAKKQEKSPENNDEGLIEVKVFQDRKLNSRFKSYKAKRDGERPRNIDNSEAANELIKMSLERLGF